MVFEIDHAPVIADLDNDGRLDVFVIGGYGISNPETNNHGRAYAVTAGNGSGPGWPMFRHDPLHSGCFTVPENQPPSGGTISGPLVGLPEVNYTFCINVSDPENDPIWCAWDWGDGSNIEWLGPYPSGQEICVSHAWSSDGVYDIQVKLKDDAGAESNWSEVFPLLIDGTPPVVKFLKPQKGFLYLWDTLFGRPPRQILFTTIVIGPITVLVSAIDNDSGMSHVEFYIDDDLQDVDYTGENDTYSWLWDDRVPLFPYTLKVTAYDRVNNSADVLLRVWKVF
jgi:hypothetical protein